MEQESNNDNWAQLESNPQVITEYVSGLGFDTSEFIFQDLFSTDSWAQDMINKPCLGLLFIFPVTDNHRKFKEEENQKIANDGQEIPESLWYMHQYAKNACGSVGVFHILANLPEGQKALIAKDSKLEKFYKECEGKDWQERGTIFKNCKYLQESHEEAVQQGDTNVNVFSFAKSFYFFFIFESVFNFFLA